MQWSESDLLIHNVCIVICFDKLCCADADLKDLESRSLHVYISSHPRTNGNTEWVGTTACCLFVRNS